MAYIVPHDLNVMLDAETPWDASFDILVSFEILRLLIEVFFAQDKTMEEWFLDSDGWKQLDNIIDLLKPLEEITKFMSKYPSLSIVIPAYVGCMEEVDLVFKKCLC